MWLCLQLVVISDPHIKADLDWPFFCEARDADHFVKNRDGGVYHGTCWPGISTVPDPGCTVMLSTVSDTMTV